MSIKVIAFRKTVASAGTAEPLSASKLLTPSFVIRALADNTNNVYVGDSTVDSTDGMFLAASESNEKAARFTRYGVHKFWDLNKVYIDVDTSSEGVIVEYEVEE